MENTFLALRNISSDILQIYDVPLQQLDEALANLIERNRDNLAAELPDILYLLDKKPKQVDAIADAVAFLREKVAEALPDTTAQEREEVAACFICEAVVSCAVPLPTLFNQFLVAVREIAQAQEGGAADEH